MQTIDWRRRGDPQWRIDPERPHIRRGLGFAMCMHGTAIPGLDMGGASLKINDDGSFNLLVGATDLGTGSDTVLAQIAAEVLGVPLEDVVVYSSDTDMTPFDTGAYASSTTYISGTAVKRAAEQVAEQIKERAAFMLKLADWSGIVLRDRKAFAPDGRSVTMGRSRFIPCTSMISGKLWRQPHSSRQIRRHRSRVSLPKSKSILKPDRSR
ncbi:MAG: molybdopterin cofactor-binding domain-containing protein [Anaerolineae bacterium]